MKIQINNIEQLHPKKISTTVLGLTLLSACNFYSEKYKQLYEFALNQQEEIEKLKQEKQNDN